ncbi:MAG: LamG-like jellyroll fold domain-containing protein [Verrucomicrobiota bacterium]
MSQDQELHRLIEAYLRGTISADDFATLDARLHTDAAARLALRRAANLDSALHAWAARGQGLEAWQQRPTPTPAQLRRMVAPWLAAAAAILLLTAGVLSWNSRSRPVQVANATTPPPPEKTAQGCAVLTQSANADWSGLAPNVRLGDILNTGLVTLNRGLAQIEFFSGATMLVEGPAQFQIVSPWEVTWTHGKARVHVPPAARGFRLLTPGMKLVDLGTEFGVDVNRTTQDMRVAVFSGEVIAHPTTGPELSLREGQGISRSGTQIERTAAGRADDFASGNGLQELRESQARTRFAAWSEASQTQARDPRLIAYYPLTEVDSWSRIVRNAALPANRDLDGGAVGVATAAGRWPEKPALEFKRPGDRVRLQIEGTCDALTLAGWVKVDGLDRTYNALFLTDGYEAGEPHWQIYEDGRLMFSLSYFDSTGRKNNQIYYSPVIFDTSNTGRWHHVAVTYDNQSGEVTQYIDGRELSREISPLHVPGRPIVFGPCELGNWGLPTQNHRFPIRNLNGRIDEFALYRAALAPDEIRALYESGKPE